MRALLTGGPYLIATAELLLSKDSSGKQTKRRLYWKVAWDDPFFSEHSSKENSHSSTSSASANPAGTADSEPQQNTASTDSTDQDASSSITGEEEVLEFVGSAFYIRYTPNKGEASNFYFKPIVQSSSKGDKYFHIVTDPDDSQIHAQADHKKQTNADQNGISSGSREGRVTESESESQHQDPPGPQNASQQSDTDQVDSDSQNAPPPVESDTQNAPPLVESGTQSIPPPVESDSQGTPGLDELEPQRYVTVVKDKLVAGLNVKHLKKGSIFKLKHLHKDVTQPLSQSQWLPEALRGSQPHILCRQGNTLRSFIKGKLMSVYIKMEKDSKKRFISYGQHVEGDKTYSYFILENGR